MAEAKKQALMKDSITQIANVSTLLREAIEASIPVAPEQYLTISIPGNVIDTRDIKNGGTFVYGQEYSAFVPPAVRQEEARLVDKMPPLSKIMVGNTGKSVARSYSRALDGLVPKKATVHSGVNQIRSPGVETYDDAMKFLTTPDPITGENPVEIYIEKQSEWADAQEAWDKAKQRARDQAKADNPTDLVAQRQQYDEWNQVNYRKFKFAVQGRWMDWVTNGHKYDVEYNFGMVDIDSIMARIEQSKESMRNSSMVDHDGANELWGVNLSPKNWATLCQQKAEGWFKRNGEYSVEQIDAEIERLTRLLTSYEVLKDIAVPQTGDPTFPITGATEPSPNLVDADKTLKTAFSDLYTSMAKLNALNAKRTKQTEQAYKDALDDVQKKRQGLAGELDKNRLIHADWTKYNIATMKDADSKTSVTTWLTKTTQTITDQIKALKVKRTAKLAENPVVIPVIVSAHDPKNSDGTASATGADGGSGTDVYAPGDELADPMFGVSPVSNNTAVVPAGGTSADPRLALPQGGSASDPWTTIKASFSATDQSSTQSSSSWGMSVGGGFGWGLWSVGGSYAHEESQTDSVSDLATCDVSVTFSALVVNIDRPWLYAELFNDFELDVAEKIKLSPGAADMHRLLDAQGTADPTVGNQQAIAELAQYNSFPAFPTSMIIAADTVIDFHGDTQHVENHFKSQANSGGMSVGWGPFSVSSSFHHSSSRQDFQLQSTSTGCRLTFGAPQVIGWVSQILPALPRKPGFEPMVQNIVAANV